MQIYNCMVRLSGSLANTVFKPGVTASEIIIFRHQHGADAVADITKTKMDKREHAAERARLTETYSEAIVQELFGPNVANMPLPLTLPEDATLADAEPQDGADTNPDDPAPQSDPQVSGAQGTASSVDPYFAGSHNAATPETPETPAPAATPAPPADPMNSESEGNGEGDDSSRIG